ncbi:hypothetical protein HK104_006306 [Borealophlyctis nickersoniae]|nr:hypothetical protein HK104_006306 [Borealophlyctis nickersoniae]
MGRKQKGQKRNAHNNDPPSPSGARKSVGQDVTDDHTDTERLHLLKTQASLLHPTSPEQSLLNVIHTALKPCFSDELDFSLHLRTIKQLFATRDYTAIFTDPVLLPVYAFEYIPGRALCYRDIFVSTKALRDVIKGPGAYLYCMGAGNGAELVGIAGAMIGLDRLDDCTEGRPAPPPSTTVSSSPNSLSSSTSPPPPEAPVSKLSDPSTSLPPDVEIHCQDLSDYGPVLNPLLDSIRSNWPLPSTRLTLSTSVCDLLSPSPDILASISHQLSSATLTTAMFVMNELLATSKPNFIKLVSRIVGHMRKGAYLLVVDSAGSFSELKVGRHEYMVYQLLDAVKAWEVCVAKDSVWYRFPDGLTYPRKLNNMRYFMRLYRKL